MADDVDKANDHALEDLERRIAAARTVVDDTVIHITCIGCGETIHPVRRKILPVVKLCADCQYHKENKL